MQNENIASAIWNREEPKTKTFQAQHGIVHQIKRVQHEKKCNMKILLHKKVQHEKSATPKNINFHNELLRECKRIVHYSAQMDDGSSVDAPLCTSDPLGTASASFFIF